MNNEFRHLIVKEMKVVGTNLGVLASTVGGQQDKTKFPFIKTCREMFH